MPDKYTPYQWLVLSKLHQLVAKYGLGSPVIVNMLWFLTTVEVMQFDIKKLVKLIYNPMEYMVF